MEVLIMNYTNWIGFHLAEALLNEGYKVDGFEGKDGNENLVDFLARNSNFRSLGNLEERVYPLVIYSGQEGQLPRISVERAFLINPVSSIHEENIISIHIPLLYGEWMPMDENGIYVNEKRIYFSSELFKREAIYIGDFIQLLLQWINKKPPIEKIRMEIAKNMNYNAVKLEKTFFVDENVPIGDQVQKVVEHYRKYHLLYPQVK